MTNQRQQLESRSKQFAIRIVKLFRALPEKSEARVMGNQLLRSGTSVAANYRAACRSRSPAEFASRLTIVVEEADETLFWLDLVAETEVIRRERLKPLMSECVELLKIFAAARRTTLERIKNRKS